MGIDRAGDRRVRRGRGGCAEGVSANNPDELLSAIATLRHEFLTGYWQRAWQYSAMPLPARLLILSAIVLTGCRTAEHAAVSTFRVIDTPAHYVREHIDQSEAQTTTTQTTVEGTSDVVTPGRPVAPSTEGTTTSTTEHSTAESRPSPRPSSSTTRSETGASNSQSKPTAAARSSNPPPAEFPVAKPVPGKPGFVYSIDPKGGMVDVTGYKSGDKAKDPYTHQIFVVP